VIWRRGILDIPSLALDIVENIVIRSQLSILCIDLRWVDKEHGDRIDNRLYRSFKVLAVSFVIAPAIDLLLALRHLATIRRTMTLQRKAHMVQARTRKNDTEREVLLHL
jgi:hypothetical protein